jgi:PAS domain S-box-containing protein
MLSINRKSSAIAALEIRVKTLEQRLKIATQCLSKISEGDQSLSYFDIAPTDTDDEGREFLDTLAKTKHRLAEYNAREQQRIWSAEGMTCFLREIQGDRNAEEFYDKVLAMIIRYTSSNQGGIFLLNDHDPEDVHLEMKACYAYSKKKFIDRKIAVGHGIIGQAVLEKETSIFLTVPNNYFDITSGLGEATPRFLLIVPLKYDHRVVGVLELGCFHKLEKYQIEFVEKVAENLASVILNIQHAHRATVLYEQSQQDSKALLEQEETLRQNIEELEATQEEMKRQQRDVEERTELMKFIVDNIPFPIFVKDDKGRYTLVNKSEASLFGLPESKIIGKDDSSFVANEDEWKVIRESDSSVLSSGEALELPIQYFTTDNNVSYVFKTTKIPFVNKSTGKKNILGVSIDLTERRQLENKLLHEMTINAANSLLNVAGRQRMLSQKIGFYAEMVVRGKSHRVRELKNSVELFQHSLDVMKDGGYPSGIETGNPLPPAHETLLGHIAAVEVLWKNYKDAANKIVYYVTFQDTTTAHARQYELDNSIAFIEEHGEKLLDLNNDLMLACIRMSETINEETLAEN